MLGLMNELSAETYVPDIPRGYTALAEWLACLIFVLLVRRRYSRPRTAALGVLFLGLLLGLQYVAGLLPIQFWIPGMLAAFAVMYVFLLSALQVKPGEALYWTARAFVIAEFSASVEWQFHFFFSQNVASLEGVGEYLFLLLVYGGVFAIAYVWERRYTRSERPLSITGKDLWSTVIVTVAVFVISNVSFISRNTPLSAHYAGEIFYVRTLVDLCGVILLLSQQEQRLWLNAELEVGVMQKMLRYQYEQYRLSKENMDLINQKYHDLKHQIAVIRAEDNPKKKSEYLDQMEDAIKRYEAQNKTGNPVLDTILTAKNLICMQENINITCVADGRETEFIQVMDLCSLVGNALDNAIEYEKTMAPEKRLIKLAVYRQDDLLVMRFENYFEGELNLRGGIPVSTKGDPVNHGYGLKSMRAVAERYGGGLRVFKEGNWFVVCVLIPAGGRAAGNKNHKTEQF